MEEAVFQQTVDRSVEKVCTATVGNVRPPKRIIRHSATQKSLNVLGSAGMRSAVTTKRARECSAPARCRVGRQPWLIWTEVGGSYEKTACVARTHRYFVDAGMSNAAASRRRWHDDPTPGLPAGSRPARRLRGAVRLCPRRRSYKRSSPGSPTGARSTSISVSNKLPITTMILIARERLLTNFIQQALISQL